MMKMIKKIITIFFIISLVCSINSISEAKKVSLGEVIESSDEFIDSAKEGNTIDETQLQDLSKSVYNTLVVVGILVAILIGVALAIKFITESAEGKAEVKNALIPYIIGCVVLFGGFTIWRIVVDVLQSM